MKKLDKMDKVQDGLKNTDGYNKPNLRGLKAGFVTLPLSVDTWPEPVERKETDQPMQRVTGFYIGTRIRISELHIYMREKRHKGSRLYDEALYMSYKNQDRKNNASIFFFEYGVIVFWGLQPYEEQKILKEIGYYIIGKRTDENICVEDLRYVYDENSTPGIHNDVIMVPELSTDQMLTISYGVAQSAILTYYEGKIAHCIENARYLSKEMKIHGMISMGRKEISRKIGELYDLRINVNLVAYILDIPNFIWTRPTLDPLYKSIRDYLEITPRVQVLDKKCTVIFDMLEMMREQLNSTHSQKLEWIVIILIFIEIVMGCYQQTYSH